MEKDKLIEENMKLVYFLISKYYPSFIQDEDTIQEGMVGLCKAASTWDESKSKFSTYASQCILNEIKEYFRKSIKHNGILSLDKETENSDGEPLSFIEIIAGEEDVKIAQLDYLAFYNTLLEEEKELIRLRVNFEVKEIAEMYKLSESSIFKKLSKIKMKWRKFIGND